MNFSNQDLLNRFFDDLLFQISKGLTHEQLENGRKYDTFERVQDWKTKFGFVLSIYSNDHLINDKPHFHFDNRDKTISCTCSFEGEIFENRGKKEIPKKILKELKYFLESQSIQDKLILMWNEKNPNYKV